MGLTTEEELADLLEDVLRLAGSPEKGNFSALSISQRPTNTPAAKSALRNFLHNKKTSTAAHTGVHDRSGANNPHTPGFLPIDSPPSVPILIAAPPGPVSVGRVTVPPFEHEQVVHSSHCMVFLTYFSTSSRTVWRAPNQTAVAKTEFVAHAQVPTELTPSPPPTINDKASGISTPGSSLPEQDYGDVYLADPTLGRITADDSELSPTSTLPHHQRGLLSDVSM